MDSVRYISSVDLATTLRTPEERPKVVVIDVRDEDFPGGHIAGAVNVPSDQFGHDQSIDAVIQSLPEGTERVVFHCMFSQQRGPRCAMRFAQRLKERGQMGQPNVLVLRGGWQHFVREYRHEPDLIAGME